MKKFIVDTGKKKYSVEANDAEHAVEIIKKIADEHRTATIQRVKMTKEKGKYWLMEYESSPYVYENEYFENKNEALSWAKRKGFKITRVIDESTFIARDEASQLQTVNALIEDEKAAVAAYNVAIENLRGKIPEESLQVLITTRDDENRHIENLQAVVNGTVTEKNLEDSMMNDVYNKFENETDVEFLKEALSEMRRYERNWNYEGKKNAGCTLPELRHSIKFAEKRLQELKNKKDSMMYDGLRLEEIESQLIKAQNEAKNKQWSAVSMRCEDVISAIKNKVKDSTVNDMGMWVPSKKRNYNDYNMSLSPDKLEIKLKAGMSGNVDRTIIEGAIREIIGDLKEVMSNKSLDQSGVDNVKQVYRELAKRYQGKLYSTNANEALDDLLRLVR